MTNVDVNVKFPCLPLATFMLDRFRQFGDKVALIDSSSNREISYSNLAGQIQSLANGLNKNGFKKGDVLCMLSPNIIEYPCVFYAVASLGGVLQATNPMYTAVELKKTFEMCKPKFVYTLPAFLEKVQEARHSSIEKIIILGEADDCLSYDTLISHDLNSETEDDIDIDPRNDVVALLFSSGTTGLPKAVQITHYNIIASVLQIIAAGGLVSEDRYVTFLPLFHIYGLAAVLTTVLASGATNVIMSRFKPEEFLNLVMKHKATILHLVPPVMVLLAKQPEVEKYDVSSVRKIFCGAAPLSKTVESNVTKLFDIDFISQGFGMTECLVSHLIKDTAHRHGSTGVVMPHTECKIINPETQEELEANKDGEVCIRGPQVMLGYLSNPDATSAILDNDGWLHTGDVGHVDEDGFLFIIDRIKELIKYKGFQVAPAELEGVLLKHPAVADCGVIGVPDDEAGELPKAFVVTKPGENVTQDELKTFVEGHVNRTMILYGGVEFIPEIPKSATGKILRRVLRDRNKQNIQ